MDVVSEKVVKVRGQGECQGDSDTECTSAAEAYISTVRHGGSLLL